MIDWDDFRVFLALERERTLSAAARLLQIDQSTVGRRLATLEAASGTRLFQRTPTGYELTAAGESVAINVHQLEDAAIAFQRKLLGQDERLVGNVRVATSDSLASWFLVPRLRSFQRRQPGITIELITGNPPVNLSSREADLSLRMSKPEQPHLIARQIGVAAWSLYASTSYLAQRGVPQPDAGLEGHDVIAFHDELRRTAGARWLLAHGNRGQVVFTTNSLVSAATATVAGFGLCPLPCVFGDPHRELERALPGYVGEHQLWLVVHPDVQHSARVREVVDYLVSIVALEAPLLCGALNDVGRTNSD